MLLNKKNERKIVSFLTDQSLDWLDISLRGELAESWKKQFFYPSPFWMALKHPIVPVVLGGSDYSLIAPENSFIDVKDFKNAQELAHHLNFLANNEVSFSFKGVSDLEIYLDYFALPGSRFSVQIA